MFARIVAAAYLLAVLALIVTAAVIANTYCENFGCIGLGIMWFAWAVAYAVVLAPGLALRRWPPSLPMLAGGSKAALVVQLLLGVVLAAVWAVKRFAA